MFTEKEQQRIDKETEADLNFQDRLGAHSKPALIFLVDHLTSADRSQRGWVLKYLRGLQDLVDMAELDPLQDRVLDAIKNERLTRDTQRGPVAMRPMTIGEWATELSYAVTRANTKAAFGQTTEALKAILTVATIGVEALEDRIDAAAADGKDMLAQAIKELVETADGRRETGDLPAFSHGGTVGTSPTANAAHPSKRDTDENKTADAAGTAPAVKSESLNNQ